ncbi:ATP-binding protein [Nonomuraea sp. NBC_00507]|uniref:ATP-dependent nuclease n=1 Tax=Nonomuraea sp. NBC_00507 TaxID=2976002 RepID=UPI002E180BA4
MPGEGRSERVKLAIDKLITTDGTEIHLPSRGVSVVVGGNNVGKSTLLNEIAAQLDRVGGSNPTNFHIVQEISISQEGSIDDVRAWMDEHAAKTFESGGAIYRGIAGGGVSESTMGHFWTNNQYPGSIGTLFSLLVHKGDAHNRLGWVQPQEQRRDISMPATNPIQKLSDDVNLLQEVCTLYYRVFRESLTLDRLGGHLQFRVGTTSVPAPLITEITKEYRDSLAALPSLHDQGDGMKSFMGLLLPIVTAQYQIIIIDEPEAFLHPPQANILGKILGDLAHARDVQVILATHDRNLLIGLLESQAEVSVVRLDRRSSGTRVHQLKPAAIKELWSDPVLRYTNILDGLFHRIVVLAEGDRDCRYYKAVLDHVDATTALGFPPGDVLFVPAGGKDGFVRLVGALNSVSVPVVVVPDIDLLNEKSKVQRLLGALGGTWTPELDRDYRVSTEPFRRPRAQVTCGRILEQVRLVLESRSDRIYDKETSDHVKAALRSEASPWQELKTYGVAAFKGEAAVAADRMLDTLEECGIVLVRAGELERLAPLVQSHKGPAWLEEALSSRFYENELSQEQVRRIMASAQRYL